MSAIRGTGLAVLICSSNRDWVSKLIAAKQRGQSPSGASSGSGHEQRGHAGEENSDEVMPME
ncbi:hypothetical protein JIN85_08970 [Luteolibacter pohnpeiensis]|uniref:Uncharacterized protein n=1 Tax=Luteolibacter pohnpeiensis TaxID=454153 RepID=A0A934VQW8_9BACT|nr:hypothetical protein [Luteolibacter pohnpeiensis]MBK1882546.1 hypothetical protein [Luteolibacter pohnpeiensis]